MILYKNKLHFKINNKNMKKALLLFICILFISSVYASPRINFTSLQLKVELNPQYILLAEQTAGSQNLPTMIYLKDKAFIEAKDVEDGKVIYSVPKIGYLTLWLHS